MFCSFACLLAIHGEYARWEGWLMLIVRAIIGVFFIPPFVSLHCPKISSRPGLSLIHMSCSFENSWLKVAQAISRFSTTTKYAINTKRCVHGVGNLLSHVKPASPFRFMTPSDPRQGLVPPNAHKPTPCAGSQTLLSTGPDPC